MQKPRRSLKNFAATTEAAVATRPAEDQRPVLKMAQDERRDAAHQYAQTGLGVLMRPGAPRQVIRESGYVYAAVAPQEGLMTSF